MDEKNKRKTSRKNINDDLINNFKKENDNIDNMLEDAFSFMNVPEEEDAVNSEYENENMYTDNEYNSAHYYDGDEYDYETEEEMTEEEKVKEKKKKNLYIALIAVLSVCIIAVAVVFIKFGGLFSNIYDAGDADPTTPGMTFEEEEDFDTMYGVTNADDLNDALKQWANNGGELMKSKNVINILLIGQDGGGSEKSNGLADSLIIASVNKTTKTITLASIMRDSYTYMNVDGQDRYNKINASCVYGGPKGVIKTIENNYKIDIDYYASVYFGSFKNVIDALGGIEVPISPSFAAYINRTTRHTVSSGDAVHLNGAEALVYARIRKFYPDSDVSRTANQRRVINAIMSKAKGASVKELYNVVEAVLPYMKTNMRQSKILSYGKQALSEGWVNFDMQQETFPTVDTRGSATINPAGSCWIVDYPLAAQQMQKLLYGKTNISLSADRVNVLTSHLTQKPQTSGGNSYSQQNTYSYSYSQTTANITEAWTNETTTNEVWTNEITNAETTTSDNPWNEWWGQNKPTEPDVTEAAATVPQDSEQ